MTTLNVFQNIDGNAFAVRISPEMQELARIHPNSVTLEFDGSNFYLQEYSEDTSDLLVSQNIYRNNQARILSESILTGRTIASEQSAPVASTSRITRNLFPENQLGTVPKGPKEYKDIFARMEVRTLKSLGSEDIELNSERFSAKVFKMFEFYHIKHKNAENYLIGKINSSNQLRIGGVNPSSLESWWKMADWMRKVFLLSSPKDSNNLVYAKDAQNLRLNERLTQQEIDKLKLLMNGVPFFRSQLYSSTY